ncbi:MAG: DHA2 family efflux MFS transporter permease subunit [Parvularculaceae bacterium]
MTAAATFGLEEPHSRFADPTYVSAGKFIVFAIMAAGMFMAILDIQIVAASLSHIQAGLAASPDEVSWIQTSYLIAEVIMIPISGYLSRALSTRIIFVISSAGFTLASLGCGLSWNMESLIIMRAIQGFIGGAMIPTVFAIAFTSFPRNYAAPLSAATGLIITLAPTIGPTVGGYISENLSWHWLFFVNLVPGAIITIVAWLYADFDKPDFSLLKRFDVTAFVMMAVCLGLVEYVLEEGPDEDWFQSRTIAVMVLIAVIAGASFLRRSLTSADPLVDFTAYRNTNFTAGSAITFTMGVAIFGLVYLLPLYLGRVRGFDAIQIGETLFITGLAMFMGAPVAGVLARKIDPRYIAAVGILMVASGTYAMSQMTSEWGFNELFWPQIIRGFGIISVMSAVNVISLGTLTPDKLKGASGLYNLMRNLGGAFGLAVINTMLTDRTTFHMRRLADTLDPARPAVAERLAGLTEMMRAQGMADPAGSALAVIQQLTQREAAVMAFSDVIHVVAIACVTITLMLFFAKAPKQAMTGAH